jgi:hypothetical protein
MVVGLAAVLAATPQAVGGESAAVRLLVLGALGGLLAEPLFGYFRSFNQPTPRDAAASGMRTTVLRIYTLFAVAIVFLLVLFPWQQFAARSAPAASLSPDEVRKMISTAVDQVVSERASIGSQRPNVASTDIGMHAGFTKGTESGLLLWLGVAALIGAAACLLFPALRSGKAAAGLITIGALLSGVAIVKEFKMESAIKIDELTLVKVTRAEGEPKEGAAASAEPGSFMERIADFNAFKLGSKDKFEDEDHAACSFKELADRWTKYRKAGMNGVLLFVGSTDDVPLSKTGQARFEGNTGLARARAEVVKARFLSAIDRKVAPHDDQMLVLVSGPVEIARGKDRSSGSPGERRVTVWASWRAPVLKGAKGR